MTKKKQDETKTEDTIDLATSPEAVDAAVADPVDLSAANVLLEDGSRVTVQPGTQPRSFRVTGTDGQAYDHCADAADGEWIYRKAE